MPRDELVPARDTILRWIERIFAEGVRRPGYPADLWCEGFCEERFREIGLENVRLEPVRLPYWEPRSWSLRVRGPGAELEIPCFPLPHAAPTAGLEAEIVPFDRATPEAVRGKVSLYDVPLLRLPPAFPATGRGEVDLDEELAGRVRTAGRVYDPEGTFEGTVQVLPFGREIQEVMEPSIRAEALAFVGVLSDYPGNSFEYYVPYDGVARPIPGVWIRDSDGKTVRSMLREGPVRLRLQVDSVREEVTCHNVLGELGGADEEQVVIGSHHDGPWSSAVEDASGVALVLAQASYWSAVPRSERPHRLVFLLNAGHMVGGAGCRAFLEQHASELDRIVLELHLEHAAKEFVEGDGGLIPSGFPETRWWFTSQIAPLESAVLKALEAEGLTRSLLLPPDAFGPQPTTDAGFFHLHRVPLVNYLTAPFYLFDSMDRLDKIDEDSLVPVTRAAIRIIESTDGVSAAGMRAAHAP
jgi:hypothetical protein